MLSSSQGLLVLALLAASCSDPAREHGAAEAQSPRDAQLCQAHQPVLTPHVINARDLGGTALAPGAQVACGAVYRGSPLKLSDAGCADAAELGVRTVIDLRVESEQSSTPDAACVNAARISAPLPIPAGLTAADYLNVLHATSSLAAAFHTFGERDAYPIYFHCTFGRDRTGVVSALLLLALGSSRESVMQEYLLSEPHVGAYPDSLNAVLDEIEQRGGAEAVLREAGVTDAELAVLREKTVTSG